MLDSRCLSFTEVHRVENSRHFLADASRPNHCHVGVAMQIKTLSRLSQCVAVGVALSAPRTSAAVPYRVSGSISVLAQAADTNFQPGEQNIVVSDLPLNVNNSIDYLVPPQTAIINQSYATASLNLHGQVGFFQISTFANASSTRTTNSYPFAGVNATAVSRGGLNIVDHYTLHSKIPGTKIINTFWRISGSLSSAAVGVQHDASGASGSFDYVQSEGESWINVTGTGVDPGPYQTYANGVSYLNSNRPQFAYGVSYKTQGGYDPLPTIDQFQGNPPATVPITLEIIPEQETLVFWNFDVASVGTVENKDLTPGSGSAGATAVFSHTMTWGGITSVIDKDTGQPITDWTLDSASGFDYSKPFSEIPEPASICLLSLAALGFSSRHCRSHL